MGKETRQYIVDVCNYIDTIFSFVLLSMIVKAIFWPYTDNDWLILWGSLSGVVLWPNKKYIAKWLKVNHE
ncbi:hypothetical protein [Veillonella caviae]|uniref:hypothetical protein n=1 Tax=Veillonella caviae TaxID=248316 RepID=UPI0023A85EA1|nr:hypothetical protein [Veillonella caviae]MCI5708676.1 hypothetical protein [Veillonella caviae]MDY4746489.1 hypothetical protein [Veillonella caviae]MDY5716013.1 hypothetical protein [Veillonella caviae]